MTETSDSEAYSDSLYSSDSDSVYSSEALCSVVTLYSDAYSDLYSSDLYIVVEPIEELLTLYSE